MEELINEKDKIIRIDAQYNSNLPEEYQDNPLVSALLEKHSKSDFIYLVSQMPPLQIEHRELNANYRMKKVAELFNLVIPTSHYYEVYSIIERMLFNSYADRNPNKKIIKMRQWSLAVHKQMMDQNWKRTSGESFLYTGPSGVGKSTLITRVAQTFPQVVNHSEFQGQKYNQAQLVWIKVKIPSDAARKSFSDLFLAEVDKCLGTTYAKDNKGISIGKYEDLFRTIVSTYKLGLLIVDELQNLSIAKSGGDEAFLNFFSSLCDDLGVALVLIGTPDCTQVLTETFTASRRLTSGGDIHRDRFSKTDTNWKLLVTKLWNYQYVNTPKKISELENKKQQIIDQPLFDEIYEVTEGIPFILTFIFVQAQFMAIEKPNKQGQEILNILQLRKAFNHGSQLIKNAVIAIKDGDTESYKDLISLAEKESSPVKIQYLRSLTCLLDSQNLTKQAAKDIRCIIKKLSDNYILNKKEKELLKTARLKLDNSIIAGGLEIEGEFEEVK